MQATSRYYTVQSNTNPKTLSHHIITPVCTRIQKYITANHSLCDGEISVDSRDEVACELRHVRVVLVPHLEHYLPLELGLLLGRELPPVV
jgi:hypothetical protein